MRVRLVIIIIIINQYIFYDIMIFKKVNFE